MRKEVANEIKSKDACTHELVPHELFPLLVLSFCGNHRSVSFKYPL